MLDLEIEKESLWVYKLTLVLNHSILGFFGNFKLE